MPELPYITFKERQSDGTPETERINATLRLFEQCVAAQSSTAEEAMSNRQLYHNIAYTAEQIDRILADGMPVTATPILNAKVQQHTGLIAGNEPAYAAVARDDSDVTFANLAMDIITYVWQKSNGQSELIQVNRDDFIGGRGIFFAYIDPNASLGEGEVRIERLEPFEVFPDPRSKKPDWSDSDFIYVSHLMTKDRAKKRWGEKVVDALFKRTNKRPIPETANGYTAKGRGFAYDNQVLVGEKDGSLWDPDTDQYRMVEEYRKVYSTRYLIREQPITPNPAGRQFERVLTESEYRAYRTETVYQINAPDGNTRFALAPNDIAYWAGQFIAATPDPANPSQRVILFRRPDGLGIDAYTIIERTRGQLIDVGVIFKRKTRIIRIHVTTLFGEQLLHEYELATSVYPICPVMSQHDGTPFPTSKASLIRSLIDQFNKKQQTEIQWGAAIAGPKIWSEEDVILNPEEITNVGPGHVKLRRGSQAQGRVPFKLPMDELPAHYFVEKRELLDLIDLVSGLHPQLVQGAPGPSREPFRSFQGRDEAQQRRIKIDDAFLSLGLTSLARVVLDLFVSITYREKVLRIVQPSTPSSAPARTTTVNQFIYDDYGQVIDILYDAQALDVDIQFVSGSTFPSNRAAEREQYLQYLQIIGPAFLPYFLKKIDLPDWEKLVSDVDQISQLQQQVQQLSEALKQAQGSQQRLENQVVQTRIQGKVDKADSKIDKEVNRVSTASELSRARIADFEQSQSQPSPMMDILDQIFSNQTEGEA